MGLTVNRLGKFTWKSVFQTATGNVTIEVFQANEDANVYISHTRIAGKKLEIEYNVFGKRTASPSEACRIYNREEKARAGGGQYAPGSPEQVRSRKDASGGRGNVRSRLAP